MDVIFVPFLTRSRFASLVGISEDVLERWVRDGKVRTFRIGKRSLVDLRQWMSEQHSVAQQDSGELPHGRSTRARRVVPTPGAEQ